jgi:hypothetical protein
MKMENKYIKKSSWRQALWLRPVILATQEAQIRRIMVQSQSWADSSQIPILKLPNTKKGLVQWLKR